MDIRKWLEHTADRAPPDNSDDPNIPEFLRPDCKEPDRIDSRYRHKRKRVSTDSSIIAPRPANHRNAHARRRSLSPDHANASGSAVTSSQSNNNDSISHPTPDHAPAKTYEKRARHKTRLDRYEPKAKKQRRKPDSRKHEKSKPKRRKSHRTGDGGRTTGLVQSFQLKNGPKNNRLTLNPDASGGLFKHGRASVQITGRGGGLPDLVFNEMRFLQKPTEHQDEPPEAEEPRKPNRKDRKRTNEEEISAYFSRTKVADVEHDQTVDRQPKQSKGDDVARLRRSRPQEPNQNNLQVQLPEKPFLGFGSKGVQPDSKDTQIEDTAYYTWSESASHHSTPPAGRQLPPPTIDMCVLSAERPTSDRRRSMDEHQRSRMVRDAPEQHDKIEHVENGQWIQTRRTRGSALVEVYQSPEALKDRPHHRNTSVTKTTLQSLPKRQSSEVGADRRKSSDGGRGHREHDRYRTSDILEIRHPYRSPSQASESDCSPAVRVPQDDKENYNPQSSFSVDRAIGVAREAAAKPAAVLDSQAQRIMAPPERSASNGSTPLDYAIQKGYGSDVAMKNRAHVPMQRRHSTRGSAQSPRQSTATHQPMPRADTQRRPVRATNTPGTLPPRFVNVRQPFVAFEDDEEMLDNAADVATLPFATEHIYANSRQAEELVYGAASVPGSGIFEAQADRLEHEGSMDFMEEHGLTRTSPNRGLFVGNELCSEPSIGPHTGAVDDDLVGFWKPNKLY